MAGPSQALRRLMAFERRIENITRRNPFCYPIRTSNGKFENDIKMQAKQDRPYATLKDFQNKGGISVLPHKQKG